MIWPVLALSVSLATPVSLPTRCEAAPPAASGSTDSTLTRAYESGVTWEAFLASARARRALWLRNWDAAVIPADVLAAVRALPGRYRLLVIAVDSCSDSVNTIPFLARLVADLPNLEMRVLHPDAARALMAARRTPDGRPATPTVILLDERGRDVGCWIERPAELQRLAIAARAGGGTPEFAASKQGWYDRDAGASTIREVAELLVAAGRGARGCDGGPSSAGL